MLASPLFRGITEEKVLEVLPSLGAKQSEFEKGSLLFGQGEPLTAAGILLSGSLSLEREDFWGNRSILAVVETGEIFGEVYACRKEKRLNINITALEKTKVLFLDLEAVLGGRKMPEDTRAALLGNLVSILADKTYYMSRKTEVLSARTTREKVKSFLSAQARETGKDAFSIPFNRQELADFLSVERSALSRELSRMQREGIISFAKNRFHLIEKQE